MGFGGGPPDFTGIGGGHPHPPGMGGNPGMLGMPGIGGKPGPPPGGPIGPHPPHPPHPGIPQPPLNLGGIILGGPSGFKDIIACHEVVNVNHEDGMGKVFDVDSSVVHGCTIFL